MPAAENADATARTDSLMCCAPWDPPVTRTVGASGSNPKNSRPTDRMASRSSPEMLRRTGFPVTLACLRPEPATAAATATARLAPTLLANPALALASCTTTGTRRRAAR